MVKEREFPRYRVSDFNELYGNLEGVKIDLRLATFGEGGCGFYGVERSPLLLPPRRVFCAFSINRSEPTKVQGNLVYCKEILANGKSVYFYGIEFILPHRPHIAPIVSTLEKLREEGRVAIA